MEARSVKPWEQQNNRGGRGGRGGGGRGGGGGGSRNPNLPESKKKQKLIAHGVVGAVPSADRVVLYINDQNHERGSNWVAPKRTEVKLSWIKAPRPYSLIINEQVPEDSKETEQEDYYWDAREYLRKLAIGKPATVEVRTDETTLGSRELGTVHLIEGGNKVDLSHEVVSAGYAKVVTPKNFSENTQEQDGANAGGQGNNKRPAPKPNEQITKLLDLQKEAASKGLGLHSSSKDSANKEVVTDFDHWNRYLQWRGGENNTQPIKHKCIVEAVISGSMVRLTILPTMESIALRIAGVRSPVYKRPQNENDDQHSEPFGAEAQWTTERYTLHRDAEVIFTGCEKDKEDKDNKNGPTGAVYYGELLIKDHSIGEILLTSGLATMVKWSAPKDKADKYVQLEEKAVAAKLKIWSQPNVNRPSQSNNNNNNTNTNNNNNNNNNAASSNNNSQGSKQRSRNYKYNGRVKSVINGAMYVIENLDEPQSEPEVVTLSSIVVPKFARAQHSSHGGGDHQEQKEHDEPFSWEAREFVRKKVIGKQVKVTQDYVRPERVPDAKKPNDKVPAKAFYTVEFDGENIGLALVANGLATVLAASGDNRSPLFDSLLLAQDRAQKGKLGVHGNKKNARRGYNDLTINKKAINAKNLIAFDKPLDGVVEYVISGNRFKVSLPQQQTIIIVVLDGVKTPTLAKTNTLIKEGEETKKETPAEPFAQEALEFSRNLVHQADVQVTLDRQDKAGAYIGYMTKGKTNVAEQILSEGLGRHAARSKNLENVYSAAQQSAKEKRKGQWKDWDPSKEEEEKRKAAEEREAADNEGSATSGVKEESIKIIVHVTEVIDSNKFYCQFIDAGKEVEQLNKMMSQFATLNLESQPAHTPERGEVVLAQFSGDGNWYRAQVRTNNDKKNIPVFYGDFGNSETTSVEYIRKLPEQYGIKALRFQAKECGLAYIRAVTAAMVDNELAEGAAYELKRLIYDQKLPATREYERAESRQSRNRIQYLNLWADDEQHTYINGELVRKGLAKVDKRPPRNAPEKALKLLREMEESAHDNRKGLWESGDPGDEDEPRDI